jgi:hypothetical protein
MKKWYAKIQWGNDKGSSTITLLQLQDSTQVNVKEAESLRGPYDTKQEAQAEAEEIIEAVENDQET